MSADRTAGENRQSGERDIAGVIGPPPLIYLAGLGLGFLLEALLSGGSLSESIRWILGGALLVAGIALMAWWAASFRRADTPMPP